VRAIKTLALVGFVVGAPGFALARGSQIEDGGRATVDLQSGKVGLAIVRQRMKPGEVIEVHTPHAIAAVRGPCSFEIVPGSAGGDQLAACDTAPGAPGRRTGVMLLTR
jgi:hypothetical protein